ncbi:hypothetical protein [Blastococcus haudaquaticus]|uniref:Uncharacterized protein n=1 Tax=Blastococcus haudaquaticus TaxID=1938745 RepID=A0A286GP05_9ACTN|nr:hypothetical protein [Blastococcus haudaquaticus]SOD97273.1 hypothetical protein SAMN06272739_1399 [Blastococcus haudaquaticus]
MIGGRRPPADAAAVRAWQRTGLAFGIPGAVLLAAALVVRLIHGRAGWSYLAPALLGLFAGLVAVVYLRRVWSEAAHVRTPLTPWGVRSSSAFLVLWGLGVLLNGSPPLVVQVPSWVRTLLAVGMLLALGVTVVVAALERRAESPSPTP